MNYMTKQYHEIDRITKERARQIVESEGCSVKHDKSATEDDLAHHVLRLRKENNDLLDEINDLLSDLDKAQKSILVRENTISKMRDLQTQLYRQLVKAREERNGADAEEALKKILEYKKKR